MSEWRCAFGFPIFYRAVYTDNSTVFQYEIVGILLEGAGPGALPGRARAVRGTDGFSKYVMGDRAIPRNLARELRCLPEEELIRRLRDTGLEDPDLAARRLEALLRSGRAVLKEAALRRVLSAAGEPERFLARALAAAVTCGGKELRRLTTEEIADIAEAGEDPESMALPESSPVLQESAVRTTAPSSRLQSSPVLQESAVRTTAPFPCPSHPSLRIFGFSLDFFPGCD